MLENCLLSILVHTINAITTPLHTVNIEAYPRRDYLEILGI